MDKHPIQRGGGGGGRNASCRFMLQKTEISAGLMGHSAHMQTLRPAQRMGLVPATSPQGLVASCELAIFASKSSRRDQL